jgi:hypothetical protein
MINMPSRNNDPADDDYPVHPRLLGRVSAPPAARWSQTDKIALILFVMGGALYGLSVFYNLADGRGVGALIAGFALGLLCDRASEG